MRIAGPCDCVRFIESSSRRRGLPRVHIEDEDGSVWDGYDDKGKPIKAGLIIPSEGYMTRYAQTNAASLQRAESAIRKAKELDSVRQKRMNGKQLSEEDMYRVIDALLGIQTSPGICT